MTLKGEQEKKIQIEIIHEHTEDKLINTVNTFLQTHECEMPQLLTFAVQESVDKVSYVCMVPYYG